MCSKSSTEGLFQNKLRVFEEVSSNKGNYRHLSKITCLGAVSILWQGSVHIYRNV
jgi:hypothetical protein